MSEDTRLVRMLRAEAEGHSSNEHLEELFLEAADEIVALREAAFSTSCKCGAEAWCPCLDHVTSFCPGTPLVGMRSGRQPTHIPEGAKLCPNCHGEPGDHECLCEGQGWIQE